MPITSISSSDFIEALHASKFTDDETIELITSLPVEENIYLFETATKRYLLKPTIEALHHGDWEDPDNEESVVSYLKLRRKNSDSSASTLHLHSEIDSPSVEAIFVPLGWLVEVEKKASANEITSQRATHYVVLWNTSTKPYSLLIVYDYYSYDEDSELGENLLTDEDIHNKMSQPEENQWYTTNHRSESLTLNIGRSNVKEFLVLHPDGTKIDTPVSRSLLVTSGNDSNGPQKSDRHGSCDDIPNLAKRNGDVNAYRSLNAPTSPINSHTSCNSSNTLIDLEHGESGIQHGEPLDSRGGEEVGQLDLPEADESNRSASGKSNDSQILARRMCAQLSRLLESASDKSEDPQIIARICAHLLGPSCIERSTFTFLGLSEPFDLACICSDTTLWKGDTGIDGQHVMHCLSKANVCLGSTLRATYAEPDLEREEHLIDLSRIFKK